MSESIRIEVAYARPDQQWLLPLSLPVATTVEQAIAASGLLQHCPELNLAQLVAGIFGHPCPLIQVLHNDDRVEIYRPLQQDPMTARRNRATG